jgi:hypothetical protein
MSTLLESGGCVDLDDVLGASGRREGDLILIVPIITIFFRLCPPYSMRCGGGSLCAPRALLCGVTVDTPGLLRLGGEELLAGPLKCIR